VGNEIDRFVDEVRAFRAFYAHAAEMTLEGRLAFGRDRVLALYTAALALPAESNCEWGDVDVPYAVGPGCSFEQFDFYAEVFDPYSDDASQGRAEAGFGSLSDDFLDICSDVSRGLALWDAGHHNAAIWEWRFHRDAHWGNHATSALRALHWALFELRGHQ
jgi:hypothetical protein